MSQSVLTGLAVSIAYYSGDRKTGSLKVLTSDGDKLTINEVQTISGTDLDKSLKPILIGMTKDVRVVLLDPKSKQISLSEDFPEDTFAAHIYSDPNSTRDWFMNDGDKETGNDTLNCGDKGSSVTIVENSNTPNARYLATICVGRGHHQATFTYPSDAHPDVPQLVIVSNLKDGTLSIIGNDANRSDSDLKVISTINLCEPDKDEGKAAGAVPNNAFPHGLVYSKATGKIYNLNNGYGTVVIIDPKTKQIEERFEFKGHSNLFISPDGKYLFGRGADRKSDENHVIAKLTVMDLSSREIVAKLDLQDIYISKYFFNNDGSKLYLTTGSSGSDQQKANLKSNVVLVYDLSQLPQINLLAEVDVGEVGTLDFVGMGDSSLVLCSDSGSGSMKIISGNKHQIIETIKVSQDIGHSRVWVLP
ncbi:MAG: hypothetical protein OEZ47_09165 [Gammaproteobacteria bacterium]|nr:hypothetical protein [Gammaproteobacteria bacterium]